MSAQGQLNGAELREEFGPFRRQCVIVAQFILGHACGHHGGQGFFLPAAEVAGPQRALYGKHATRLHRGIATRFLPGWTGRRHGERLLLGVDGQGRKKNYAEHGGDGKNRCVRTMDRAHLNVLSVRPTDERSLVSPGALASGDPNRMGPTTVRTSGLPWHAYSIRPTRPRHHTVPPRISTRCPTDCPHIDARNVRTCVLSSVRVVCYASTAHRHLPQTCSSAVLGGRR